jgi:hypothetical protein
MKKRIHFLNSKINLYLNYHCYTLIQMMLTNVASPYDLVIIIRIFYNWIEFDVLKGKIQFN